jgi:hypothetical protein
MQAHISFYKDLLITGNISIKKHPFNIMESSAHFLSALFPHKSYVGWIIQGLTNNQIDFVNRCIYCHWPFMMVVTFWPYTCIPSSLPRSIAGNHWKLFEYCIHICLQVIQNETLGSWKGYMELNHASMVDIPT